MPTPVEQPRIGPDEYLAWEREQLDRHECYHGEVFAMAGGSPRHNAIAANVVAALHGALRAGPCRVLTSDQEVHVPATEHFVYADATVVCGRMQLRTGTADVIENPALVAEVLAKSTEVYDRGLKWQSSGAIPSLCDYVLVSQQAVRVEHYARQKDGSWRYRVHGPGERLALAAGVELAVDAIYEQGVFDLAGD
ncbi:MAG: Uma2 family endonuclease [Deltaproteobacteria bacterium]|nr:Uma2 family endonuclease [Deltaproteobacteria bacterium]